MDDGHQAVPNRESSFKGYGPKSKKERMDQELNVFGSTQMVITPRDPSGGNHEQATTIVAPHDDFLFVAVSLRDLQHKNQVLRSKLSSCRYFPTIRILMSQQQSTPPYLTLS